ncbi:MAG: hypothetical protein HY907_09970 [Deltaproteobacteria bacterium]|nr:hypothetical protein [Deltaproteobacteria bacterium]
MTEPRRLPRRLLPPVPALLGLVATAFGGCPVAPRTAEEAPPADPTAGMSADEQWAWAVSHLADLATYRTAPETLRLDAIPPAADGTVTLWTAELGSSATPPACRPLVFGREGNVLFTYLREDGAGGDAGLEAGSTRVEIRDGELIHGASYEVTERDENGEVVVVGAVGSEPQILGALSEQTADVLRFDLSVDWLAVTCLPFHSRRLCTDGTEQVCESCVLRAISVPSSGTAGGGGMVGGTEPVDCGPCPRDEASPLVEPLDRIVRGRTLYRAGDGHGPALWLDEASCTASLADRSEPAR